jgi:hypothetical protein
MKIRTRSENVSDLWERRHSLCLSSKKRNAVEGFASLYSLFEELNDGKEYSQDEMMGTKYWDYIKCYSTEQNVMFNDSVNLFHDIKKNGMRDPLDIIVHGKDELLYKGSRRLAILKVIGTKQAMVNRIVV